MRRNKPQGWFNTWKRLRLERDAKEAFPDLVGGATAPWPDGEIVYRVTVHVADYGPQSVRVHFPNLTKILLPSVFLDQDLASPHRYRGGSLCIWDPDDVAERKWHPGEGLKVLLEMVAVHLFKEGWWRETGEWLGDQHVNEPDKERAA